MAEDPLVMPQDEFEVVRKLIELETVRREAAEAKLATIREQCVSRIDRYMEGDPGGMSARFPDDVQVSATWLLSVIGSEEESRD